MNHFKEKTEAAEGKKKQKKQFDEHFLLSLETLSWIHKHQHLNSI